MLEEEEKKKEKRGGRHMASQADVRACRLLTVAKGDSTTDAKGFVMKPSLDGDSFLKRREN